MCVLSFKQRCFAQQSILHSWESFDHTGLKAEGLEYCFFYLITLLKFFSSDRFSQKTYTVTESKMDIRTEWSEKF